MILPQGAGAATRPVARDSASLLTARSCGNILWVVPMGGSDPMEVAALGKPIVVGPHTDNFALPVSALREADAIRIADSADAVVTAVCAVLRDPGEAEGLGTRARRVVIDNQGATARTVTGLVDLLNGVSR